MRSLAQSYRLPVDTDSLAEFLSGAQQVATSCSELGPFATQFVRELETAFRPNGRSPTPNSPVCQSRKHP
jgi:hypothetical protein